MDKILNINNLSIGTYNLTIIDLVCNNNISGLSFTITEPDLLTYTSFNSNNTSCDTSICNGSFGITLSGEQHLIFTLGEMEILSVLKLIYALVVFP